MNRVKFPAVCSRPEFLHPTPVTRINAENLTTLARPGSSKSHRSIRAGGRGYINAVTSADVSPAADPAPPASVKKKKKRKAAEGRDKSRRGPSPPLCRNQSEPPSPPPRGEEEGAVRHGEGFPSEGRRRRREDEGRGGADGPAEAELVVARHRARRGVGAPPPRPDEEGLLVLLGAAARAERHGRRPRRAARVPRSGLRVRAPGGRGVRGLRRGKEPPRRDAPGPRPLLRRRRQRRRRRRRAGGVRQPVHLRRLVRGLRAVADREPPLHTLPRRPAGDGEDEAEAVGAGGGVVPAQPLLNHGSHRWLLSCASSGGGGVEKETNQLQKKKKRILPASERNQRGKNEKEKTKESSRVW